MVSLPKGGKPSLGSRELWLSSEADPGLRSCSATELRDLIQGKALIPLSTGLHLCVQGDGTYLHR